MRTWCSHLGVIAIKMHTVVKKRKLTARELQINFPYISETILFYPSTGEKYFAPSGPLTFFFAHCICMSSQQKNLVYALWQ